jgi:Protein of unknown function (DUF2946)
MSHILITDLLRRRLAVWLAVLVVGLGALAPTVSHALVLMRGGSPAAVEICTPAGPRWLTVADDQSSAIQVDNTRFFATDSPDGQESASVLVHCPFCLLFTGHGLAPPQQTPYLFFVKGEPERPTTRQAFFFHTVFSLSAAPRGPPNLDSLTFVA